MKLILDFHDNEVDFYSGDDEDKSSVYNLCKSESGLFGLWWNKEQFIWEKDFESLEVAVANVIANLVQMLVGENCISTK